MAKETVSNGKKPSKKSSKPSKKKPIKLEDKTPRGGYFGNGGRGRNRNPDDKGKIFMVM